MGKEKKNREKKLICYQYVWILRLALPGKLDKENQLSY